MKVAVVHDWLVSYAGAEKVTEQILDIYPEAELFAVCDFLSEEGRAFWGNRQVQTSFVQRLPSAKKHYQKWLPLMPLAVEQIDVRDYDLIISSSHAVAKGVIPAPHQTHLCYCHSPMRYAWDMQNQYLKESGLDKGLRSWIMRYLLHRLRAWDVRSSFGVDAFAANSSYIARRIEQCYRRESQVIYPGVDVDRFNAKLKKEDYYLVASRLAPYKCIPMIVEAFSRMPGRRLIVAGDGPELKRVKTMAPTNVDVLGYVDDIKWADLMAKAKAFIFAAEEDFGIVNVEAQASGTPVICYSRGGSRETIIEGETGLLFNEQSVDAILGAVNEFEKNGDWSVDKISKHAQKFSKENFKSNFLKWVSKNISGEL